VSAERDEIAFAPASVGAVVRRAAPRLVRDGFGPLACFFAGWKLIDLTAGIAIAAAFGVAMYVHERRSGRPGMIVRVALALVAVRASVGLASGSARTYLAMEVAIDVLFGCVVFGSLRTARPFTSWFTEEVFPMPNEVLRSDPWRHAMRFTTAVWGTYFLARGLVRLVAWLTLSTNGYVLVAALSDAPFLIGVLAWSVYYTTSVFRGHPQWGPLFARAQMGGDLSAAALPPPPR
jgi:intracellular septation protein A